MLPALCHYAVPEDKYEDTHERNRTALIKKHLLPLHADIDKANRKQWPASTIPPSPAIATKLLYFDKIFLLGISITVDTMKV